MKHAINCVSLKAESLEPAYRIAAEQGVGWLEIFYGRNFTEANGEHVVAEISGRGLSVSAVHGMSQLYREPAAVERNQEILLYQVDLAARAGAPYAITHFGHGERDDRRAIEAYVARLTPCLERAEELGVTILLENEFDMASVDPAGSDVTRRPEVVRELVERVGSERFRPNFDPANYYFAGVEPFPYAYGVLEDVIEYVHVKDGHVLTPDGPAPDEALWRGATDGDRAYGWCPMGEGALNWDGILRALARRGYGGFLSHEPHCQRVHAEDAWRQSLAYVDAIQAAQTRLNDPST